MKKQLLILAASLSVSPIFAQSPDYKKEMIESGEKQEKTVRPENETSVNDYSSFKRTQAWNNRVSNQSILSNTKQLSMPIIGGRVRSSLVDKDNNISLVAPSGGGLWKFKTDGSSFSPVDDLGSFMAITSISQNPFNKQQIIIGTGDEQHGIAGNGAFISNDGGNTFSPIKSTDPTQNTDLRYIRYVKYSPQTQNTIYLTAGSKVYKSKDSGATWTLVFDEKKSIRSIDFISGTGIILGVTSAGIYTSFTGEKDSFTLSTSGIISGKDAVSNMVVATHASNRNIAYVLHEKDKNGKVYKTTNGGASWTEKTTPSFNISQGWFCLTIGVHPTDPNIVVAGALGWGYTTDGGTTWLTGRDLEVDFHDVHFHSSDPNVAYVGYDQGIGSVDFSKTKTYTYWDWNQNKAVSQEQALQNEIGKNPGFNTSQIYYGDYFPQAYGDAFIFGQQDGGSFSQINNINKRVLVGDGGTMFINKQNPTKAFGCTQYGRLQRTNSALEAKYDYEQVGSFYNNYPNFITQFAGNNADGNQIYMPTNTTVERTLDDGANFSTIANHALKNVKVATEYAKNPIVYVVGTDRQTSNWEVNLIRIENAATTPVVKTKTNIFDYWSGGSPDQIMVDPNDRNIVYVTTSGGEAFKISDLNGNPANWTKESIKGNINDVTFNVVIGMKGQSNILIAGTNVGVFYSEDKGVTWTVTKDIPYTQVTDLRLRDSDKRLFVFTYGRGAWATTITPSIATDLVETASVNYSVYPNPTSDVVNINIEGEYQATLFDQSGEKVITVDNESMNVTDLTSGMYILHVYQNNELVAIEKVVIK